MRVFNETQKFDQWFMKLIYFGLVAILLYCLYYWYIAEEAVDKVGANDTTGQLLVIASIVFVLVLFSLFKLTTEIDEIGVHYQFLPFHFSKQTVRWAEMEKCYVRQYSPIREYGGWGFRTSFGSNGKAYNVKGNKGIQIKLKTGKKILIGTQKEKDAQQVIDRLFKNQRKPKL